MRCEQCEEAFHNDYLLARHHKVKHQSSVQSLSKQSDKPVAATDVNSTDPLECKYCGKVLEGFRNLRQHILQTHRHDECKFKCDMCDKRFLKPCHLTRHLGSVHGMKSPQDESIVECDVKIEEASAESESKPPPELAEGVPTHSVSFTQIFLQFDFS